MENKHDYDIAERPAIQDVDNACKRHNVQCSWALRGFNKKKILFWDPLKAIRIRVGPCVEQHRFYILIPILYLSNRYERLATPFRYGIWSISPERLVNK